LTTTSNPEVLAGLQMFYKSCGTELFIEAIGEGGELGAMKRSMERVEAHFKSSCTEPFERAWFSFFSFPTNLHPRFCETVSRSLAITMLPLPHAFNVVYFTDSESGEGHAANDVGYLHRAVVTGRCVKAFFSTKLYRRLVAQDNVFWPGMMTHFFRTPLCQDDESAMTHMKPWPHADRGILIMGTGDRVTMGAREGSVAFAPSVVSEQLSKQLVFFRFHDEDEEQGTPVRAVCKKKTEIGTDGTFTVDNDKRARVVTRPSKLDGCDVSRVVFVIFSEAESIEACPADDVKAIQRCMKTRDAEKMDARVRMFISKNKSKSVLSHVEVKRMMYAVEMAIDAALALGALSEQQDMVRRAMERHLRAVLPEIKSAFEIGLLNELGKKTGTESAGAELGFPDGIPYETAVITEPRNDIGYAVLAKQAAYIGPHTLCKALGVPTDPNVDSFWDDGLPLTPDGSKLAKSTKGTGYTPTNYKEIAADIIVDTNMPVELIMPLVMYSKFYCMSKGISPKNEKETKL